MKRNTNIQRKRRATVPPETKQQNQQIESLSKKMDKLMKTIPRGTFAKLGAAAGGQAAGPLGALLGGTLGGSLSRVTGYGDYTVSSNSMVLAGDPPAFSNSKFSTQVRHREFIADVTSPGATFANTTYIVNPGNSTLFPWLGRLAPCYQQYRVKGMVFEFKSTCSEYASGAAMGKVILASNYNVLDSPYDSAQAMENSEYAVANKPSTSFFHPVECARGSRRDDPFYVRDPDRTDIGPSDARWYDMLSFQVATTGLSAPAGSTIGELWVSYDIELLKPIVPAGSSPVPSTPAYMTGYVAGADMSATSETSFTLLSGAGTAPTFEYDDILGNLVFRGFKEGKIQIAISRYNPNSSLYDAYDPANGQSDDNGTVAVSAVVGTSYPNYVTTLVTWDCQPTLGQSATLVLTFNGTSKVATSVSYCVSFAYFQV